MENEIIGIYVEENDWLLSPMYKHLLAKRLTEMGLSRRGTIDWLANIIFVHTEEGGKIYDEDGEEIFIYDEIIDDAYFDDQSFCWNTDVKRFASAIPKRRSSEAILLRLQLIDAAFRIEGDPIET